MNEAINEILNQTGFTLRNNGKRFSRFSTYAISFGDGWRMAYRLWQKGFYCRCFDTRREILNSLDAENCNKRFYDLMNIVCQDITHGKGTFDDDELGKVCVTAFQPELQSFAEMLKRRAIKDCVVFASFDSFDFYSVKALCELCNRFGINVSIYAIKYYSADTTPQATELCDKLKGFYELGAETFIVPSKFNGTYNERLSLTRNLEEADRKIFSLIKELLIRYKQPDNNLPFVEFELCYDDVQGAGSYIAEDDITADRGFVGIKHFLIGQMAHNDINDKEWRYEALSNAIEKVNAVLPLKTRFISNEYGNGYNDGLPLVISEYNGNKDELPIRKAEYLIALIYEILKDTHNVTLKLSGFAYAENVAIREYAATLGVYAKDIEHRKN